MIDIHSHILYGIDDGAISIEESLNILKKMGELGITDVILTPHYMFGTKFHANNIEKQKRFQVLNSKIKEEGLSLKLYLGNEVYADWNLKELLQSSEITTLNNSKYLLIEFPLNFSLQGMLDLLFDLRRSDIIPVVAHPERYQMFVEDPKSVEKLLETGVLLQCNLGSIVGIYGKNAKKLISLFLKHKMVSFLASDIHHSNGKVLDNFDTIMKELSKILTKEELKELLEVNPRKILEDGIINTPSYFSIKQTLFNRYK